MSKLKNETAGDGSRHGWQPLSIYLFIVATTLLLCLNAYASINHHLISSRLPELEKTYALKRSNLKEIGNAQRRHIHETSPAYRHIEQTLAEMREHCSEGDIPFRLIENEFMIFQPEHQFPLSTQRFELTIPSQGAHSLNVQATYKEKPMFQKSWPLSNESNYRIQLTPETNRVLLQISGQDDLYIEAPGLKAQALVLNNPFPCFASPNQPYWDVVTSSMSIADSGIFGIVRLSQPADEQQDEFVFTLKLASDGPMVSAADHPDTVRHLLNLIQSGQTLADLNGQFKDGQYIFE